VRGAAPLWPAQTVEKKETGCIVLGELTLPVLLPSAAQDLTVHQTLARQTKVCCVLWRNGNGNGSTSLVKFCDNVIQPRTETRRLQRKMDRSKRATNHESAVL
jgi:hypothetical protein